MRDCFCSPGATRRGHGFRRDSRHVHGTRAQARSHDKAPSPVRQKEQVAPHGTASGAQPQAAPKHKDLAPRRLPWIWMPTMLIFLYRSNSQEVPLIFSVSLQRQGRASAERNNERAGGLATSNGAPLCNQTGAPIPSGPLGARRQPAPTTACHSTTAGLVFNLYTIYAPSLASRPQSMLSKFPLAPRPRALQLLPILSVHAVLSRRGFDGRRLWMPWSRVQFLDSRLQNLLRVDKSFFNFLLDRRRAPGEEDERHVLNVLHDGRDGLPHLPDLPRARTTRKPTWQPMS